MSQEWVKTTPFSLSISFSSKISSLRFNFYDYISISRLERSLILE
jgi:hypothetical protein